MVAPLLAPLLTTLATSGLNLLVSAVKAKGKEFVEGKLGISIEDATKTEEGIFKLKQLELAYEEFLIEASIKKAEIDLKDKALDIDNTKSARDMNTKIQETANASKIAKEAAYYLDFIIVCATFILTYFAFFKEIPTSNKELTYMALGSLLTMCGTILNFHRGTSRSSANKDDVIKGLSSRSNP